MLFEPPLPPDSLMNWPIAQDGQGLVDSGREAPAFEEAATGTEVESDDSLRRLVGQMLAEMAAAVAPNQFAPSMDANVARATERFLSFSLAGEVYAVALAGILETDRLPRVTRVPGLPAWAIGVSNLRGAILPVVDLRRLLNLEEAENPHEGRILVVRPSPSEPPVVLVVDRLEGVALLAPNELHPAPVWLDGKILPYLEGIGSFKGRLVNVLDLGRLFAATGVTGDESHRVGEAV
jgi:chemotaxis signal transduction protein